MKTAALRISKLLATVIEFAKRHPKIQAIGVVLILANEIRGVATVAIYLKTFGLALPT